MEVAQVGIYRYTMAGKIVFLHRWL